MINKSMNVFLLFIIFLSLPAFGRIAVDSPARAIWKDENKISLTLPSNLNVNGVSFYYLKNDQTKVKVLLDVSRAYDRKVELLIKNFQQDELLKIITGPLSIIATRIDGEVIDETSVQLAGILDQRFYYDGSDLGATVYGDKITLKLWAPTANEVQLFLYKDGGDIEAEEVFPMLKSKQGVWEAELGHEYKNYFYLYKVKVFNPAFKSTDINFVTDPYSKSLSANSSKTQIIDVNDSSLFPLKWTNKKSKKTLNKVIYEAHLRDLTSSDTNLKPEERGTFLGLSRSNSKALKHLKMLADSGLTYIHFLPINDIASINENKSKWSEIEIDEKVSGDSELPQQQINKVRHMDGYNWGYDPYHFMTPEGSYSVHSNGSSRILELRQMIQSLNNIGLRTIVDVVFNHTYSSGSDKTSVFNKVVPLYYYRLNEYGNIYNSSCCSDTATENKMMEKLMVDAVIHWAKTYKVDGFRFDLMSFHTKSNLIKVKNELSKLTLEKDGVNGSELYLYGEGWTFGSLVEKNYNEAMTQLNSYGLGVGMFNDRFREAIRGGSSDEKSDQGFTTGLFYDFNKEIANRNTSPDLNIQKTMLNHYSDVIKYGLAGNLRDFKLKNFVGDLVLGKDYYFRGSPVAYAATTDETINYVSVHDGYALWDVVSAKAPFHTPGRYPETATTSEKQRMVQLSLGLALFSQGVPFIEGGSEILRSKNGDIDSYDSGDWFNRLNFDLIDNNWGKGLPPSFKNYNDWSFWSPRLRLESMKPDQSDISTNLNIFKAYLKVRASTKLFEPKTLNEVQNSVSFLDNLGPESPGVIAMQLKNSTEKMLIIFNANINDMTFKNDVFYNNWKQHPDLNEKIDPILKKVNIANGKVFIPARSIVVLVPKEELR